MGQCKLGIVHNVFHSGYTSAGLRSAIQEGPGAGSCEHFADAYITQTLIVLHHHKLQMFDQSFLHVSVSQD